jgi:hypothetical protein
VCGNPCDQMRLDSDDTLGTTTSAQQVAIKVETSHTKGALASRDGDEEEKGIDLSSMGDMIEK